MTAFAALVHQAFVVCALLALPALAVATAVGTAIAILQAATQVQDQTLSLLPKLVAVGGLAMLVGPAALGLCARLFETAIAAIPALVRGG